MKKRMIAFLMAMCMMASSSFVFAESVSSLSDLFTNKEETEVESTIKDGKVLEYSFRVPKGFTVDEIQETSISYSKDKESSMTIYILPDDKETSDEDLQNQIKGGFSVKSQSTVTINGKDTTLYFIDNFNDAIAKAFYIRSSDKTPILVMMTANEERYLEQYNSFMDSITDGELSPESEIETETLSTEVVGTEYTSKTIVRIVQEALNNAGYDCGTPDGIAGQHTKEALMKYQTDNKLSVNGVITDELLDSLGVAEDVREQELLEATKSEYSTDFSYESLMRNPKQHKDKKYKISGKVMQVYNNEDPEKYYSQLFFYKDGDYDQLINVYYDETKLSSRFLEDDYITVWGTMQDLYSYETISGAQNTIPFIKADIIELS